ncbi:MAG: hypothetical protein A3H96_23430 [Acidobacteria bacterium RIFCSPLOWO2_02_FULL_67_36]|nr:MAG: hypothetical protein A3H96_23430 [Acidobacteria bacterium RIFCSPLOWO2_02_FULL_67_36]OFW20504.1 MAG: hypothetical protein A3G21_23040 [Acidobacteria bacterium RIFCSPLOWO2_12_FULL_66_21]
MKFTYAAGLVVSALAAGCVTVDSQGQIVHDERRYTVTGIPDVRVTTFDGSIQVRSWDKPEVLVEIEKRGATREAVEALEITSRQHGNTIDLEVRRPRKETLEIGVFGTHRNATARLIVTVPQRANLRARSGDGSIRVERVEGGIDLRSGDGGIRAIDVTGELTIDTGDGSVVVDGLAGSLALQTGDGGIDVTGRPTAIRLHTGDGSIVVRAQPGTEMTGDWDISSGDGGVSVYLPSDFGADLDAHTGDGVIHNDLGLSAEKGGEESRRTLRGRLGTGGRSLRIRTGDGSIRLRAS